MSTAFLPMVWKDLVLYFSDRRALLMSLAAPIAIAAFIGFLFAAPTEKTARIPIALIDADASDISRAVGAGLRGDGTLELREVSAAEALAQLRAGKLRAVVELPAGFGAQAVAAFFGPGPKPTIGVQYDPSQAMVLPVVRGLLTQHGMQAVSAAVFGGGNGDGGSFGPMRKQLDQDPSVAPEVRRELTTMFDAVERVQRCYGAPAAAPGASAALGAPAEPFRTHVTAMTSGTARKYNSYAHSFAGMGVQFILMMGVELGVGLLTMRRLGLWQRLRAAPVSRALLLGSRTVSGALIAGLLMLGVFGAGMLLFGVRIEGSVAGFFGLTVAFALLTATFGLLIAAIGRTPEATRGLAILVTLLMVMLGGAWVPSFIFPEWLQTVSLFVPTRWAVDGFDAMTWRGLPLADALAPIGVMLGFSAAFAALALNRFDWNE